MKVAGPVRLSNLSLDLIFTGLECPFKLTMRFVVLLLELEDGGDHFFDFFEEYKKWMNFFTFAWTTSNRCLS